MFGWQDVLDFWFGELDPDGIPDAFHRGRWFRTRRPFDQEIRRRFLSLVVVAGEDGLVHWRDQPGGQLAELLLLDQFTRNIYRGTSLAFGNDRLARKLCAVGLVHGGDAGLSVIQRAFYYMPLQHSESLADQRQGVELYEQLAAIGQGPLKVLLEGFVVSSRAHLEVIARFGRFPHRNEILNRSSTPAELDYLAGDGRSYGQ